MMAIWIAAAKRLNGESGTLQFRKDVASIVRTEYWGSEPLNGTAVEEYADSLVGFEGKDGARAGVGEISVGKG